jgi:hypothetical protein
MGGGEGMRGDGGGETSIINFITYKTFSALLRTTNNIHQ